MTEAKASLGIWDGPNSAQAGFSPSRSGYTPNSEPCVEWGAYSPNSARMSFTASSFSQPKNSTGRTTSRPSSMKRTLSV